MVRVLTIIHQDDAGPGVFADVPGAELVPWKADREPAPAVDGVDAALVLGAAANVEEPEANPWMADDLRVVGELLERRVPTLGVCLGAQLLAKAAGGSVERAPRPEIGWYEVALEPGATEDPVIGALPERFATFQWHSYVAAPPDGAISLARSEHCLQAFRLADAPAWGIQFHAEVSAEGAASWTRQYDHDEDAVAMDLDPVALQAENDRRMEGWNQLGRDLFARFLVVGAVPPGRPPRSPA
ncbi:MAG TPA: type 1 glutamine amidotransferase [Thermoleophilaceae bacterium]|nr:type 1 glutamine amidotransferase [Thermoleophilaceae bacterium]